MKFSKKEGKEQLRLVVDWMNQQNETETDGLTVRQIFSLFLKCCPENPEKDEIYWAELLPAHLKPRKRA